MYTRRALLTGLARFALLPGVPGWALETWRALRPSLAVAAPLAFLAFLALWTTWSGRPYRPLQPGETRQASVSLWAMGTGVSRRARGTLCTTITLRSREPVGARRASRSGTSHLSRISSSTLDAWDSRRSLRSGVARLPGPAGFARSAGGSYEARVALLASFTAWSLGAGKSLQALRTSLPWASLGPCIPLLAFSPRCSRCALGSWCAWSTRWTRKSRRSRLPDLPTVSLQSLHARGTDGSGTSRLALLSWLSVGSSRADLSLRTLVPRSSRRALRPGCALFAPVTLGAWLACVSPASREANKTRRTCMSLGAFFSGKSPGPVVSRGSGLAAYALRTGQSRSTPLSWKAPVPSLAGRTRGARGSCRSWLALLASGAWCARKTRKALESPGTHRSWRATFSIFAAGSRNAR